MSDHDESLPEHDQPDEAKCHAEENTNKDDDGVSHFGLHLRIVIC